MTLKQLSSLIGTPSVLPRMALTQGQGWWVPVYSALLSQYLGKEPRLSWGKMKQKIWLKAGLLGTHHVLLPILGAGEYIKRIK